MAYYFLCRDHEILCNFRLSLEIKGDSMSAKEGPEAALGGGNNALLCTMQGMQVNCVMFFQIKEGANHKIIYNTQKSIKGVFWHGARRHEPATKP